MSISQRRHLHQNSLAAYDTGREELFSAREIAILSFLKSNPCGNVPKTDREIMKGLGFTDPNSVRPRITELIKSGVLAEEGSVECQTTRKQVRLVCFNRPPKKTGQAELPLEDRRAS